MSIPSLSITNQGIEAPSTQEVIDGLWQLFRDAFGSDLSTNIAYLRCILLSTKCLALCLVGARHQSN